MTSSDRHSHLRAAISVRRALGAIATPAVVTIALALLLIAVAACGDDDGGTPSASDAASPTSSSVSATTTPTPPGDGNGGGNGQASPTVAATVGVQSPAPGNTGTGTATIAGVQYDFSVSTCAIQPDLVFIVGFGVAPDGNPFIGTTQWNRQNYQGVPNAIEVGIGTNSASLLQLPEKVYKLGNSVVGSSLESLELDETAFEVTVTGKFIDLQAPDAPPVPGTFSLSCS